MKRFMFADGEVLFEPPVYVSKVMYRPICPPRLPQRERYTLYLRTKSGLETEYSSKWKVEVERERNRLLSFDWNEEQK